MVKGTVFEYEQASWFLSAKTIERLHLRDPALPHHLYELHPCGHNLADVTSLCANHPTNS